VPSEDIGSDGLYVAYNLLVLRRSHTENHARNSIRGGKSFVGVTTKHWTNPNHV